MNNSKLKHTLQRNELIAVSTLTTLEKQDSGESNLIVFLNYCSQEFNIYCYEWTNMLNQVHHKQRK